MAVEIVTGYEDGKVHISPDDVGHGNAGIIGVDKYVLPVGNKFALVGIDGRNVTIGTGDAMFNGRHVRSDENATFEITATDTSAYTRHDLICFRYTRNNTTNFEKVEFFVVKGVASTTNPADPSIPNPNSTILNNDIEVYMPLHRVVITGDTISKVEPVYVVSPALSNTLHSDDGTNVKVNDTVLGTIDNLSYVNQFPLIKVYISSLEKQTIQAKRTILVNWNLPDFTGYTKLGVLDFFTNHGMYVTINTVRILYDGKIEAAVYNFSDTTFTNDLTVFAKVLYVKTGLL